MRREERDAFGALVRTINGRVRGSKTDRLPVRVRRKQKAIELQLDGGRGLNKLLPTLHLRRGAKRDDAKRGRFWRLVGIVDVASQRKRERSEERSRDDRPVTLTRRLEPEETGNQLSE
jgi:hypothetical protein